MNYHLNINKLISDMRGPKGLKALTEEIAKISAEIYHTAANDLGLFSASKPTFPNKWTTLTR